MEKIRLEKNNMNKKIKKFSSSRLTFMPIKLSDCTIDYLSWVNDPKITKYMGIVKKYNLETLKNYIKVEKKNLIFGCWLKKKQKRK